MQKEMKLPFLVDWVPSIGDIVFFKAEYIAKLF